MLVNVLEKSLPLVHVLFLLCQVLKYSVLEVKRRLAQVVTLESGFK